jgi:hypothetical protein
VGGGIEAGLFRLSRPRRNKTHGKTMKRVEIWISGEQSPYNKRPINIGLE